MTSDKPSCEVCEDDGYYYDEYGQVLGLCQFCAESVRNVRTSDKKIEQGLANVSFDPSSLTYRMMAERMVKLEAIVKAAEHYACAEHTTNLCDERTCHCGYEALQKALKELG